MWRALFVPVVDGVVRDRRFHSASLFLLAAVRVETVALKPVAGSSATTAVATTATAALSRSLTLFARVAGQVVEEQVILY